MIDSKDLQKELITMVAEYFHRLDDDEKEQAVQKMTNLDAVLKIL
jgi:hypothetical protein